MPAVRLGVLTPAHMPERVRVYVGGGDCVCVRLCVCKCVFVCVFVKERQSVC